MLVKGSALSDRQTAMVKAAFIHRWTVENRQQATAVFARYGFDTPTVDPIPDAQWLAEHAFHFIKDGSRLMHNRRHAEPSYAADFAA